MRLGQLYSLRIMKPDVSVRVTRPWHWGIVIVGDPSPDAPLPEYDESRLVSADDVSLTIAVRHAQDAEDIDEAFAEAQVEVHEYSAPARPEVEPGQRTVFEGALRLARGRLSVGDADGNVVIDVATGTHAVVVSVPDDSGDYPTEVRVNLYQPAPGQA